MPELAIRQSELRLLIVEDDDDYAALIIAMLESLGSVRFRYDRGSSLRAALDCLTTRTYDVVLLDLGLPDAQELEGLRGIVNRAPDLPVVILTGEQDELLALEAVKEGAQDYLLKTNAAADVLGRSIRYAIQRKRSELHIKGLAYRDSLTALPNRFLLMEHLAAILKRAKRDGHVAGLFFVDIDRFKQINDSLGHSTGDEVLQRVAHRLRQSLRDNDILARFGGDEFVAVAEVKRRTDLNFIAENLLRQLRSPFTIAGKELFITASVGVSSFPKDGVDATKLLRNADRAMYRVKAEGRDNHRLYAARFSSGAPKLAVNAGLRRAVERDELLLHFQPLVDLRTGCVDGVEALVRWRHPSAGLVAPSEFIPVAEETGLILSIERWVMQNAMTEVLAHWQGRELKLAINLSTRHFDHPELPKEVRDITRRVGFDPHLLELELTERGLMHHPKRVMHHLKEFRRLGIHVALDDFGTGYSCLGLMKKYPLNALKIDRSFVRNCATDPTNQALVVAIIRMGHALGLTVTAEGVENEEQLAFVHEQGCDRAQGTFFGRPVPGSKLQTLLERRPIKLERVAPRALSVGA